MPPKLYPLTPSQREDLRQQLATLQHERFQEFIQYLYQRTIVEENNQVIIPQRLIQRFLRQMRTPFHKLPTQEKATALMEADLILEALEQDHPHPTTPELDPSPPTHFNPPTQSPEDWTTPKEHDSWAIQTQVDSLNRARS